jgi:hypothetical protein
MAGWSYMWVHMSDGLMSVGHWGHVVEGRAVKWKQVNSRVGVVSFLSESCSSTHNNRIGC